MLRTSEELKKPSKYSKHFQRKGISKRSQENLQFAALTQIIVIITKERICLDKDRILEGRSVGQSISRGLCQHLSEARRKKLVT